MTDSKLTIVGRMAHVHLHKGQYIDIPAKIDTGADASSIDASNINITDEGALEYTLFRPSSMYYDGTIHKTLNFRVKVVKSSNGQTQIRYTVTIPIYVEGKKINGTFTLTDRSKNTFPILIGARMLKNKFEVNVAYNYDEYSKHLRKHKDITNTLSSKYTLESNKNPIKFYKDIYLKQEL